MRTNNPRAAQTPTSKLVSDKAMERANKAISALIAECLASSDPLRFATVERLARVGQDLRKAVGMRAADHMTSGRYARQGNATYITYAGQEDDGEEYGMEPRTPGDFARNPRLQEALIAGLKTSIQPLLGDPQPEREAHEMATLIKTIPAADDETRAVLEQRLAQLRETMKARINAEQPSLVLSDVERGHQVGAGGSQSDARALPDADRSGGESAKSAA